MQVEVLMGWKNIDYGLLMVMLISTLAWVFVFYPRGTSTGTSAGVKVVTAEIFTDDGNRFTVGVGDIVRVTHKDQHVGDLTLLAPGLYRVQEIVRDSIGEVISFTNPRFPKRVFRCGTDVLWAQHKYVSLQPYTKNTPDYEAVMTEFKSISSADGEAVASKK
jgi:hypothetical protein